MNSANVTVGFVPSEGDKEFSLGRASGEHDTERPPWPVFGYVGWNLTLSHVDDGYVNLKYVGETSPAFHVANGGAVIFRGWRTEERTEAVTFSGSTEAGLSNAFAASGVTVVTASPFVDADGGGVGYHSAGTGKWRTDRPATGTLVVSYTLSYRVYRVYYNLPDWAKTALYRDGLRKDEVRVPPLIVLAYVPGKAATLVIEKEMVEVTDTGGECPGDEWEFAEDESQAVYLKVYEADDLNPDGTPKPGASYVKQKIWIEYVERCKQNPAVLRRTRRPAPEGATAS